MKSIRLLYGNRAGRKMRRHKNHLLHHYHITTDLTSCQVPKLLHFCYIFITFSLQIDYATVDAVALFIPNRRLYTVYSILYPEAASWIHKLEKLQAASWKSGTLSWKLELEPPLELHRRAGTHGELEAGTSASWHLRWTGLQ